MLKQLNVEVEKEQLKRVKAYCVDNEIKIREFVELAIKEYFIKVGENE